MEDVGKDGRVFRELFFIFFCCILTTGGTGGIRTLARFHPPTFLAGKPLIATWVLLQTKSLPFSLGPQTASFHQTVTLLIVDRRRYGCPRTPMGIWLPLLDLNQRPAD